MLSMVFCHFCEIHGPRVIFCTDIVNGEIPVEDDDQTTSIRRHCEGCFFDSHGSNGFVTRDDKPEVKYVSSSRSFINDNTIIQQSCIRSLSCEVYLGGREGVVYFGDDIRGHVLSYCFLLKDSQARGFKRTYSILVMARDKYDILNNWNTLIKLLDDIANCLREKSSKVYDNEVSSSPTASERRTIRLDSAVQAARRGGRSPLNTQRSESKARSLKELTDDSTIFFLLHLQMASFLKRMTPKDVQCRLPQPQIRPCSLRNLYVMLGREKFLVCAYHTVIGHQVIVRCNNTSLSRKILDSLSQMLPASAVKMTFDVEKYYPPQSCNLIGLSPSITISPEFIHSPEVLIIEVGEEENQVKFSLNSRDRVIGKLPQFIVNVDQVIRDTNYSDSDFQSYLSNQIEEWMDKSKLAFTIDEFLPSEPRLDEDKRHALSYAEEDIPLITFWSKSGVPAAFTERVKHVKESSSELLNG